MSSDTFIAEISDLKDIDRKTQKPVKPRLQRLGDAVGIYRAVLDDDGPASRNRAKVDAMFDGEPPYDQTKLLQMGQGGRCNLNFGEAQRHLDSAQAGYVDLVSSVEFLVDVKVKRGTPGDIEEDETNAILNEEISSTIRDWPEFHSNFLTLTNEFLKHGVGFTYFEHEKDWRFAVGGLRDFKIPRSTRANEEAIDIAFMRRDYAVHELLGFIKNEAAAEAAGWDIDQVKQAILHANRQSMATKGAGTGPDWEELQQMIKNTEMYSALRTKSVRVVHTWVKETNGKVSQYIWEDRHARASRDQLSGKKGVTPDFMYKRLERFERTQEAFVLFTYGVGNNGTYHSIRGMGQRIFPTIQTLNRLLCQTVDAAAMAGGIMVRPNSTEDLRELAVQTFGPYNVLGPNWEAIPTKAAPNLQQNMLPVASDMRRQLEDTSDFYSTARAAQGSPYRNTLQVQAELESATRLSSANLALFYASFDRLIREVTHRIVHGPKSDEAVREFYRRCKERGLTDQQIKSIDDRHTKATRAIGAGNPAARINALDQLNQERPFLDEVGNRDLTFDRVAAHVGYDQAKRYVKRVDQPRGSIDESFAVLENSMLAEGTRVEALPAQLHGVHLGIHLPPAAEFIQAVVGGVIDPVVEIESLDAHAQHIGQHAQFLAPDPVQQDTVGQALDIVAKLGQIVENTQRSIDAQGAPGEDGQAEDAQAQAKLRLAEVDAQIKQMLAQVEMEIKQSKAEQDQRLADFKAAAEAHREAQRTQPGQMFQPFNV